MNDKLEDKIEIIKGHDPGGYFWIMPVKIDKNRKPSFMDPFKEMRDFEISIDEMDVHSFLAYFLFKYFNPELSANKLRKIDDLDEIDTFAWYLEYNIYTYEEIKLILEDIKNLINILSNHPTKEIIQKAYPCLKKFHYKSIDLSKEILENKIYTFDAILSFYKEFVELMENMMNDCKKCNLISFMGP